MIRQFYLILFLIIPLLACQSQQNTLQAYKLNSGRVIYPKQIGPLITPNMPNEKGFVYNYQTQISLDNVPILKAEAEEIWSMIRPDFEKIPGITYAVIKADERPEGVIIKKSRSSRFVITKKPDGSWEWANKR
jgi:hypothetical protein